MGPGADETHREAGVDRDRGVVGAIEAGGTKWTCAISHDGRTPARLETFPTSGPRETIDRAIEFFEGGPQIDALGIGAFGPIELSDSSSRRGFITRTPKPGWADTDLLTPIRSALGVPVALDTDVNAAIIGEHRVGAAMGLDVCCYVTIGTGIGAGIAIRGTAVHGLLHPEFGHIRVPHDFGRDPFAGACPFHGDCLEGLASGEALRQRWGRPGEELEGEEIWALEADYLALGLLNLALTFSPERIVVGGGVLAAHGLLGEIRSRFSDLAGGYPGLAQMGEAVADYIVPPKLGSQSGIVGALALATEAAE